MSAWAQVVADTIEAIGAITPSYQPGQPWRHGLTSRDAEEQGRNREFIAEDWTDGPRSALRGAGEKEMERILLVEARYQQSEDIHEITSGDEQDIANALFPSSTYPDGSWGALKFRELEGVQRTKGADGTLTVTYRVRCIYRLPVTGVT